MVTQNRYSHPVFGQLLKLSNGIVEIEVSLDFGPRILSVNLVGFDNMLYQDLAKSTLGEAYEVFGGEQVKLYGGHRLWISPEVLPRCYHPDNEAVTVIETGESIMFKAAPERANGIQKSLRITFGEDEPRITIEHMVKNIGLFEIELAPWAITMFGAGSTAVLPITNSDTGVLPNRNLVLWSYSRLNDKRLAFCDDYIVMQQDNNATTPNKIGFTNESGWVGVFKANQLLIKFTELEDADYPDGGCTHELYTNNVMLECETLGSLQTLAPGEIARHIEEWELYEQETPDSFTQENIQEIMGNYIG